MPALAFEGTKYVYSAEEYALEAFDSDEYRPAPAYDPDDYDTAFRPLKSPKGSPQKPSPQRLLAPDQASRLQSAAADGWRQARQRILAAAREQPRRSGADDNATGVGLQASPDASSAPRPPVMYPKVLEFAPRTHDADEFDGRRAGLPFAQEPPGTSARARSGSGPFGVPPGAVAALQRVARDGRQATASTVPALLRESLRHLAQLLSQVGLALRSTGGALCTLCAGSYFGLIRSLRLLRLQVRLSVRRLRQRVPRDEFRLPPAEADRWWKALLKERLPRGWFDAFWYVWMRPWARHLRTAVGLVSFFVKAPALMVYAASKMPLLVAVGKLSLLSSGALSLPVLAPLLLGTGMLLRSITANASYVFPRIGLTVLLFWCLWFAQGLVHNIVSFLRAQGALDGRLAGGIITTSEIATLVTGVIVLLSMLGVNVSALLLPAGVAVAFAAQDITRNFISGLFLFVVQPFRLGDRVAVCVGGPAGAQGAAAAAGLLGASPAAAGLFAASPAGAGWFEGVCEKMDLRYTCLRAGGRRLMVPNTAFMAREFLVADDALEAGRGKDDRLLHGVGGPPSPHYMSSVGWADPWAEQAGEGAAARGGAFADAIGPRPATLADAINPRPAPGNPPSAHDVADLEAEYVLRLLREKPVHAEVKEAAVKDGLREIFRLFHEAERQGVDIVSGDAHGVGEYVAGTGSIPSNEPPFPRSQGPQDASAAHPRATTPDNGHARGLGSQPLEGSHRANGSAAKSFRRNGAPFSRR